MVGDRGPVFGNFRVIVMELLLLVAPAAGNAVLTVSPPHYPPGGHGPEGQMVEEGRPET